MTLHVPKLLIACLALSQSLISGPPMPSAAANQAMQANMQMQMHMQMQMQMSRARLAALQAQRRSALEQATRGKDMGSLDTLPQVKGEAWRLPLVPGADCTPDGDLVVVHEANRLYARTRDKNAGRWMVSTDGPVENGPVVAGGVVVYVTKDYRVVALDRATGQERYKVQLDALKSFLMAENNKTCVHFPIIDGQRILLTTYGKGADGEAAGKLYALDLGTGAKLWEAPLAAGADHPPVVIGERVLVGGGAWVQAFARKDGALLWKAQVGSSKWISMGVEAEGRYFFTVDRTAMAIDLAKGEILWRADAGEGIVGDGQRLLSIRTGVFGGRTLVALDAKTGLPAWERKGIGAYLPWIQDGKAYFADGEAMVCVAVQDGKNLWQAPLPKASPWPPVLAGNLVLVGTPEGKTTSFRCLDAVTGKEVWKIAAAVKPGAGMLTADGDGILFFGKDGELVCLK